MTEALSDVSRHIGNPLPGIRLPVRSFRVPETAAAFVRYRRTGFDRCAGPYRQDSRAAAEGRREGALSGPVAAALARGGAERTGWREWGVIFPRERGYGGNCSLKRLMLEREDVNQTDERERTHLAMDRAGPGGGEVRFFRAEKRSRIVPVPIAGKKTMESHDALHFI